MRRVSLLLALLVACQRSSEPLDPVDGTDDPALPDTEPVDSEPADTEPSEAIDSGLLAVDTASTCVVPLDRPRFPPTWDDVLATFTDRCVVSWRCEGPDEAVAVLEQQCFGARTAYYDPAGLRVAEAYGSDTGTCPRYDYALWAGYHVTACPFDASSARLSPDCALPVTPVPAVTSSVPAPPPLPTENWGETQELLAGLCHGRLQCLTSTGQTFTVIALGRGPCAGAMYHVLDVASGHVGSLVNLFSGPVLWVPGATSEQIAELQACVTQPFEASEACGFVGL